MSAPGRADIARWLMAGIDAVNPEWLVAEALPDELPPQTLIAIGKAAPAMVRGVARKTAVEGICITNEPAQLPDGVELLIGEHPIPAGGSLEAGIRAKEMRNRATLALISGGGSSLCELPIPGLDFDFVTAVDERLLRSGEPITTMNLVRSHLSQIKCGGLGPIKSLVLSDVSGQPGGVVSSGPTASTERTPEAALEVLMAIGFDISEAQREAITNWPSPTSEDDITVIGDGRTAADGVIRAADQDGFPATRFERWVTGDLRSELGRFLEEADPGLTVAAGEPQLAVEGPGVGGRNTHAALLAAKLLAGTDYIFGAIASDGIDGHSRLAGAIVDGDTVTKGGHPEDALRSFDSGTYFAGMDEAIETGATGTNVADLWAVWKPQRR